MNELADTLYSSNGIFLILGILGIVGILGGHISKLLKITDVVIYFLLGFNIFYIITGYTHLLFIFSLLIF